MGVLRLANPTLNYILFKSKYPHKFLLPFFFSSSSSSFSKTSTPSDDDHAVLPVLIVGAGPVGLTLSIFLTKLGVKCAIMEKNKAFSTHPQAHFINNRTMEVFRKVNGLAEKIQESQPPMDLWRKFVYCISLTGPVLGTVDHMLPQDSEKLVSPISVGHFSQYKLTRLLAEHLQTLGFQIRESDSQEGHSYGVPREREVLMGLECVKIERSFSDCVNVTASYVKGGKYEEKILPCRVLVGADGAGSTVRKLMGIGLTGEENLQKLVSVYFFSRDLGEYLKKERPGMLYFVFNTEAIGVLVAHDLESGEFVLQMPFYPPQQNIEDFSPKICEEIIFKLVGRDLMDIDVLDIKPWVMHAEVAEKYVSCDNHIIIAGDAAHRFPPAGGFGMNTGIQDAHNLAWKLASVIKGSAPPSFLCTYEAERRPIALYNTALSVKNFRAAMEVPAALGLDPSIANSVHQVVNQGFGSILPSGVQRAVLDRIFTLGRAQVSEYILNENNPLGLLRLAKLKHIFDEGRSLQLQFPAEDLGFRYLKGALVPDCDANISLEEPTGRRREYIPSANPGSRLPHMNVRVLLKKKIISTLDLVRGDVIEFLLIIAPKDASYYLAHAAFKVAGEFQVSTRVCIVWPFDADSSMAHSEVALSPWKDYIDVQEVKNSPDASSWWDICQMTCEGAILVRPDEHIGWRVKSQVLGDPIKEMKKVFAAVLGFKSTSI